MADSSQPFTQGDDVVVQVRWIAWAGGSLNFSSGTEYELPPDPAQDDGEDGPPPQTVVDGYGYQLGSVSSWRTSDLRAGNGPSPGWDAIAWKDVTDYDELKAVAVNLQAGDTAVEAGDSVLQIIRQLFGDPPGNQGYGDLSQATVVSHHNTITTTNMIQSRQFQVRLKRKEAPAPADGSAGQTDLKRTFLRIDQVDDKTEGAKYQPLELALNANEPAGEPRTVNAQPAPPGHLSTASVTPVEVKQPKVNADGTEGELEITSNLRLCRWLSERVGVLGEVDRAAFPQQDPDRVVIRVTMPGKKDAGKMTVKISTAGSQEPFNDAGAEMEFVETPASSGVFESEPIALVTDVDYDALPVGPGTPSDGAKGDRTFIAAPGGSLQLESSAWTGLIKIPIKPYTNEVKFMKVEAGLTASDLSLAGALAISENQRRFREIFSQLHIKVTQQTGAELATSDVADLFADNDLSYEEIATLIARIDAKNLPANVIKLVWLPKNVDYTARTGVKGLNLTDWGRPDISLMFMKRLAQDTTLAIRRSATVPHEAGHGIGGLTHITGEWRLMAEGSGRGVFPENPDGSGKHWSFNDGNSLRGDQKLCPAISQ